MVTRIGKRLVIACRVGGLILSGVVWAVPGSAQSGLAQQTTKQGSTTSTAKPAATKSAAAKPAATAKKSPPKPLVYVDDERSVKAADASTSKTSTASASKTTQTSTSPKQSADLTKAFEQNCPSVGLTDSKAKAAYDVTFQREPGTKGVKGAFGLTNAVHKTTKIEVMNKSGRELFSETGHSTNQLVKDACTAIGTPGVKVAKN
jgi:hypothetical protein